MVDQITVERLADWIDAGEQFSLIDTRPADSFDAWHIQNAENIPYDPTEGVTENQLNRIQQMVDGRPVVAICGKGLTSTSFGFELDENGIDDVSVVAGGMEAWSKVYEVVPIETARDDLVVRQLQRRAKGCLGYVIGSTRTDEAAVVDATRQTDQFKVVAQEAGLTIEHVLDTHVHADHISGSPRLAEEVDAPYYLGAHASDRGVEYDYEPLSDGDTVEVGSIEIEALHAPGHTSEMVNYLVGGDLLLTGDTLFVDSVGRTELQFGDQDAADGAELLYETLHETIFKLSDEIEILPGHLSVTSDGRYENGSPGEPLTARLGDLREQLDVLQLGKDEFIHRLTENIPEKPPNYEEVIAINTGQKTVDDDQEATELELGPNNCAA
jgi:glyoxylase-like metal-dependent hydrolase (beta-lactamase superfamily II)/rhodanese-related sulfurtransferase